MVRFMRQNPWVAVIVGALFCVGLYTGAVQEALVSLGLAFSQMVVSVAKAVAPGIVVIVGLMLLFGKKPWKGK